MSGNRIAITILIGLAILSSISGMFILEYAPYILSISVVLIFVSGIIYKLPEGKTRDEEGMRRYIFWKNAASTTSSILLGVMIILLSIVEFFALLVKLGLIEISWDIAYTVKDVYVIVLVLFLIIESIIIIACLFFPQKPSSWGKISGGIITGSFIALALVIYSGMLKPVFEPHHSLYILAAGIISEMFFMHFYLGLPTVYGLLRKIEFKKKEIERTEAFRRKMWTLYIISLVFVVVFVSVAIASQLQVISPERFFLKDIIFGTYVIGGIVLLIYLGRYSMRLRKREELKKRKTPEEIMTMLLLGISLGLGAFFGLIGILMYIDIMKPIPIGKISIQSMDFIVAAVLLGMGPYGFYHNLKVKQISRMEASFPDFLRDLAESKNAGMTLTQALLTTAKGKYGGLTDEIRKMAVQITWGISFVEVLRRFGERVRTPLVQRSTSLIIEADRAGGNVGKIIRAAADDAREIKQIQLERRQSMSIYVIIIYLAFFVFLAIIEILYTQFIPEIHKAVTGAAGVSVGGLAFAPFDIETYRTLFFHAALIQGIGGGLVAGVMEEGRAVAGLRHVFIMVIISYAAFRFLVI